MPDQFYLTESDVVALRQLVTEWRSGSFNRVGGRDDSGDYADRDRASDVLVVRAPDGGIPALDDNDTTGSGTFDVRDDVPGVALCRVYQMQYSGVVPKMVPTDVDFVVFNSSTTAVPARQFRRVARDRWGTWWVLGGDGGGTGVGTIWVPDLETIRCETTDVGSGTGTVTTGTGDDVSAFVVYEYEYSLADGLPTGRRRSRGVSFPTRCQTTVESLGQGVVTDDGAGNCTISFPNVIEKTVIVFACGLCDT